MNFKHLMVAAFLMSAAFGAQAERLKDIASISGVRSNQLIGYGLVVGLNGTGDQTTQTPFTLQTFNNMLSQFGIKVPPGSGNVQLKNVAAVSISADLPAFAKPGQQVDITVASIGNSKSLRGGTLLLTPLKGIDGNVYAVAQGNLVVGGFDAEGRDGSKITVNVPSAGRIPGGASVERSVPSGFNQGNSLTGSITVTVADVLPNGIIAVRGEKWMTLNTGDELVRIAGLVRADDIATDNTVSSTRIADARITYSGTGSFADASQPGWFDRFFLSPLFPF